MATMVKANLLRKRVLLFFCTWELWYHFCRFFDLWPLMIWNIPIIQCIIHNIIWIWIWCGIEKIVSFSLLSAFWTFFEFGAKRFLFCFSINDNHYFISVWCDFFSINEMYYLMSFCLLMHKSTNFNKMIVWPRWLRRMACK